MVSPCRRTLHPADIELATYIGHRRIVSPRRSVLVERARAKPSPTATVPLAALDLRRGSHGRPIASNHLLRPANGRIGPVCSQRRVQGLCTGPVDIQLLSQSCPRRTVPLGDIEVALWRIRGVSLLDRRQGGHATHGNQRLRVLPQATAACTREASNGASGPRTAGPIPGKRGRVIALIVVNLFVCFPQGSIHRRHVELGIVRITTQVPR